MQVSSEYKRECSHYVILCAGCVLLIIFFKFVFSQNRRPFNQLSSHFTCRVVCLVPWAKMARLIIHRPRIILKMHGRVKGVGCSIYVISCRILLDTAVNLISHFNFIFVFGENLLSQRSEAKQSAYDWSIRRLPLPPLHQSYWIDIHKARQTDKPIDDI